MDALKGLKQLADKSVDLILTDPPYNLGKDFENDNLTEEDYIAFLLPILNQFKRIIKPKHSIIIFFDSGKKLGLLFKCLLFSGLYVQKAGFLYKPNDCSYAHNRILRTSEIFIVLSSTQVLNHDGEKFIHDVIISNHRKKEKWYHPTAKSKEAIKELILSHSLEFDLIVDCFMGSGTTAVVCKETNRKFIGFEISKEYYDIAMKRLAQLNNPSKIK